MTKQKQQRAFHKVLVANRGEIAVRIMRTLRELGIDSVAVHSPIDKDALHAQLADQAVPLGADEPAGSYLDGQAIVNAALQTGAQAIHPGYGFLSENAEFAALVDEAGLVFVGPPAEVIARLGDKTSARRLMAQAGVPIIPGMQAAERDPQRLRQAAAELGYPLLVKAAGGGGGKGMRAVLAPAELDQAIERARSEALSAFGSDEIYLERLLQRPRHVELQVLADTHGHCVHLHERECSIQRRHQKLLEETPCPVLDEELRARMGAAAVTAARAAGYVNAGTVEFLLEPSGDFHFLEVNTRLQVEHPITELCLGLDLVRHQLEIAAGRPLKLRQQDLRPRGWAMECRIYAEDPAQGFLPSPGELLRVQPAQGPGLRFDAGVRSGSQVPVHYDPILGKLCAWAEDRPAVLARMERALKENVVLGVHTTTEFLLDVLRDAAFRRGDTHTGFVQERFADWKPSKEGDRMAALAWLGDAGTGAGRQAAREPRDSGRAHIGPWRTLGAWDLLA